MCGVCVVCVCVCVCVCGGGGGGGGLDALAVSDGKLTEQCIANTVHPGGVPYIF